MPRCSLRSTHHTKDSINTCCPLAVAFLVLGPLQGGSEKLGDEDLEAVLDKVVKMLAYISGGGRRLLCYNFSSDA